MDLPQAPLAPTRLGSRHAPLDGAARLRPHASDRLPLHLQTRLPGHHDPRPLAFAFRVRRLWRVCREGADRATAPLPGVGPSDRGWPPLRGARRRLVYECALALPARRGRHLGAPKAVSLRPMAGDHPTVLGLVGRTPLVRLQRLSEEVEPTLLAKLEYLNPGGSAKDRIGLRMIEQAERDGKLAPGGTIVE